MKIDKVLSACTSENEYKSVDKLVDDILEAELYTLPKYLTACIAKASLFSPSAFKRTDRFYKLSSDTKANIFIMRCEDMESRISNCMNVLEKYEYGSFASFGCVNDECEYKKKIENAKTILS